LSEFHRLIEQQIPRLRRYARALTRNRERADDPVQDTLGRALIKEEFWQPGTNLRAWLFTIMHNQNVNNIRRDTRESAAVDIERVSATLPATTDPTATRKMFELERAASPASTRAAAGHPARGPGRHVLRGYGRNCKLSNRHGPLAPFPRARCSSQAFGYGGTAFRDRSAAGSLMGVTVQRWPVALFHQSPERVFRG